MAKIKEVIVATLLPAIKAVGKAELKHVLSGIREHHSPDTYKSALQSLHANFYLLREMAVKSRTKVDDGIVDLILEAVKESAEADGVVLS